MMIILHDEATLLHETVELLGSKLRPALESPERIKAILASIREVQAHELRTISTSPADEKRAFELAQVTHGKDYLSHLRTVFSKWLSEGLVEAHESVLPECFRLQSATTAHKIPTPPKDIYARAGYYAFDMSTGITQHSWTSIIASANLAIQATEFISSFKPTSNFTTSRPRSVLALTRPPGHHCTGTQAGGYCYINNILLPSTLLRLHHRHQPNHAPRFAILDLDFHHGNGTQELTYPDSSILYISIHGQDEFPYYTGSASETGPPDPNHPAHGTNLNLPLAPGSSLSAYLESLSVGLEAAKRFKPDYLLVSLGFDTFHLDPLGKFDIETKDYRAMAAAVRNAIPDVPALILLEGGYVIDRLGANLLSFLDGWEEAEKEAEGVVDGVAGAGVAS